MKENDMKGPTSGHEREREVKTRERERERMGIDEGNAGKKLRKAETKKEVVVINADDGRQRQGRGLKACTKWGYSKERGTVRRGTGRTREERERAKGRRCRE